MKAVALAGVTYAAITWMTEASNSTAAAIGGVVAGFILRGRVRVPFIRAGWRRMW